MMYLKVQESHKAGDLIPIKDDSIFVYCDVCKSYKHLVDVSNAAFGVCSFEQLNACEECSARYREQAEEEAVRLALGWPEKKMRKITLVKK